MTSETRIEFLEKRLAALDQRKIELEEKLFAASAKEDELSLEAIKAENFDFMPTQTGYIITSLTVLEAEKKAVLEEIAERHAK